MEAIPIRLTAVRRVVQAAPASIVIIITIIAGRAAHAIAITKVLL